MLPVTVLALLAFDGNLPAPLVLACSLFPTCDWLPDAEPDVTLLLEAPNWPGSIQSHTLHKP